MLTVLISSYDVFAATWPPCWHALQKYWPNRPWPVRFITNHLDAPCGNPIKVGTDESWTQTTKLALQAVGSPIILWMHDDCWLCGPVDTPTLVEWANLMDADGIDYIRLSLGSNEPPPGSTPYGHGLYIVPEDYMYRASLQPSLWRVETFLNTLKDGESPWDFEIKGSRRARGKFLAADRVGYFPYLHGAEPGWDSEPVIRGHWQNSAYKYAKTEGIQIDFSRQPKDG